MMRMVALVLLTFATADAAAQLCVQRIVNPTYPRLARIAQIEGKVTVQFSVDGSGKIAVANATGPKLLVQNTEDNLRHWILCADEAPKRSFTITYIYVLQGQREYHEGPADVVFQLPQSVTLTARPYEPQPSNAGTGVRRMRDTRMTAAAMKPDRGTR